MQGWINDSVTCTWILKFSSSILWTFIPPPPPKKGHFHQELYFLWFHCGVFDCKWLSRLGFLGFVCMLWWNTTDSFTKQNKFLHNRTCNKSARKKKRERKRYPEENLPRALGSWSSGFWVWRSWTRWSDGRGVPFAAWETGGRWEQQRVRQRQGEEEGADGGMLKGT